MCSAAAAQTAKHDRDREQRDTRDTSFSVGDIVVTARDMAQATSSVLTSVDRLGGAIAIAFPDGSQVDVQCSVDGQKASIVSMTPVATPDPTSTLFAYKGPEYQDYADISANFNRQLDDYLAMSKRPAGYQTPF